MGSLVALGAMIFIFVVASPLIGAVMLEKAVRKVGLTPITFTDAWKVFLATTCYVVLLDIVIKFGLFYGSVSPDSIAIELARSGFLILVFLVMIPVLARRRESKFWLVSTGVVIANLGVTYCLLHMMLDAVARFSKMP